MLQSAESPLSSRLRSLVHEIPSIKCAAFIPLPLNHSQPPLFAHGTAFTFPEANAQDPITNGTRLAIHAHLGPVLKHLEACAVLLAGEHGQLDAGAVHVSEQSGSVFSCTHDTFKFALSATENRILTHFLHSKHSNYRLRLVQQAPFISSEQTGTGADAFIPIDGSFKSELTNHFQGLWCNQVSPAVWVDWSNSNSGLGLVWTSPAQQGAGSGLSGAGAHAVLRLLIEVLTDLCRL
ncbi:hypothetical protein BCR44DRAFT_1147671 [Catenaria anguillulae PL171]|uniref:Uncharacterized protein n=1 Tax=Catenaria anguillulae PL171 TaxID=765915 RepID=A0A1Y2HJ13_9FUNG|nr:hypothetical protein BCR44DRAFT_1147671 [Catenaria anguillulae PL171]